MVRRDKAVYIEKPILQNPLDRHQIAEPSTYRAVLTREVAYCPGCGKHLRVYEKKIKQNIRDEERAARQREFASRRFHHHAPREHEHSAPPVEAQGGAQGGARESGAASELPSPQSESGQGEQGGSSEQNA
jgi:hypothetical protein